MFSRSFISSDISKVGVWKEARKLSDPELSIQVPHLLDLVLASNAPSTTSKYSYGWARWRRWTRDGRTSVTVKMGKTRDGTVRDTYVTDP